MLFNFHQRRINYNLFFSGNVINICCNFNCNVCLRESLYITYICNFLYKAEFDNILPCAGAWTQNIVHTVNALLVLRYYTYVM